MKRTRLEVRLRSEEELQAYEQAAGPRRLSEWVRMACREKLARDGGAVVVSAPRPVDPVGVTPPRPVAPRRHHVRCVCPTCRPA